MNKINAGKLFHTLEKLFISSPFGYRDVVKDTKGNVVAKKGFHAGTDYSANGNSIPTYALEDGIVLNCGKDTTGAKFVYVHYPRLDYVGLYYHLACINVKKNQKVTKDTKIGMIGMTGNATGNHLHFEWCKYKEISKPLNNRTREDFDKYIFPEEEIKPIDNSKKLKYKIGDEVLINGNLYVSSNAEKSTGSIKNKITKITRVVGGTKHPYNTIGDLGWMNEEDIKLYSSEIIYVVKKGDNLSIIANKYNTNWKKIYEDNKEIIGNNPNLIEPGQKLIIR